MLEKRRVKRLEKKGGSRTHRLKRLYKVGLSRIVESSEDEGLDEEDAFKQGRIDDIDANEDIYLVNVHRDEDMFVVNDLEGDDVIIETEVYHEVVVETKVASKDVNLSVDKVTLAQALAALKSAKPKADKVMLQEPEQDEGLGEEDASKQGKIADIDANEDIYFVNVQTDEDMFCVNDLDGDEVIVESVNVVKTDEETRSVVEKVIVITIPVSAATTTTITDVEMTLAQELAELKSAKPKATTITTTPTLTTTGATIITAVSTRSRAKGLLAFKLQAKEEEEERLAREKAQQVEEANIAWNDIQAKINADYQLVQRLQAQEQDEFTDAEKARFSKKQKLEEDKEFEELKQCLEIIPDDGDDVTIATPLSTKSPTIVDYKIYREGKKSYF
ncbi:hypothetical protein Tco_0933914 [Tanacetum coccineum]